VLFIGKAQEKASVFRTEKRRDARGVYPWIIRSTAMVNHYDVYLLDRDVGPLFITFWSYFPYRPRDGSRERQHSTPERASALHRRRAVRVCGGQSCRPATTTW
jgi:hypothetical protein